MKLVFASTLLGSSSALRVHNQNKNVNNQVSKIVDLLRDIVTKTQADEQKDKILLQQNKEWCAGVLAQSKAEQEYEKEANVACQSQVADNDGKILMSQNGIKNAVLNAGQSQQELDAAKKIREAESAEHAAASATLKESLLELGNAISVISSTHNQNSLLSTKAKKSMMQVISSLDTVTKSVGIEFQDHSKLKALVQATEDDEGDDFELTPIEATESAYESKSGNILQLLDDLQTKAASELSQIQDKEMKAQHSFELFAQTMHNKIDSYNSDAADLKQQLASYQQAKGEALSCVAATQARLDVLKPHYNQVSKDCNRLQPDFNNRQAARTQALSALASAIDIIGGTKFHDELAGHDTAYALVQTTRRASSPRDEAARTRAAKVLQAAASRLHSVGLEQIASRVSSRGGQFDKVRDMIEGMIQRLVKQAADEATQDSFCKEQIQKATAKKDVKSRKQESYAARKGRAEAQIAQGKVEIKESNAREAQAQQDLAELNEDRAAEVELYQQFESDSQEAISGLRLAIQHLSSAFPGDESFLQVSDVADQTMPAEFQSMEYSDAVSGPVAMLEQISADIEKEFDLRKQNEHVALQSFNDGKAELEVIIATEKATSKSTAQHVASTAHALTDISQDLDTVTDELESLNKQLAVFHKQCTPQIQDFAARAAARNEEIEALKGALRVLQDDTSGN